jgi:hypothetical protein
VRHRHERWLHTRITEELEDALKREARRLRSPVSLVVRNVLEAALDLVDDVVDGGVGRGRAAGEPGHPRRAQAHRRPHEGERNGAARDRDRRPSASLDDVYGWHEVLLNRDARCATCAAALAAGEPAHRGLREDSSGPAVFLCSRCVAELRSGRGARPGESAEKETL